MTNATLTCIHGQLAEQAGQQAAATDRKSPTIIGYPLQATWVDIDRRMEAFRQCPVSAKRAALARELLVEYLLLTGQLSR
jgi:hypothetical protein